MASKEQQFWTKSNIVQSLQEMYKRGMPLNCYRLMRDRSPETSDLLKSIVGRHTTGSGLYIICKKKFGSLDAAFRAADIKPCQVRGDTTTWTKAQMVRVIEELHKNEIPLNVAAIEKDQSEKTKHIIYNAGQLNVSPRSFYRASINKFGSWDQALKQSGIDISTVKKNHKCWSKKYIIACIRKISRNGIKLNLKNVENDKNQKISKLIAPDNRSISYAKKLILNAKKEFGSWDNALDAAGLDSKKIHKRPKFWTREMMVNSIIALEREEVTLDAYKVQFDTSERTENIITKVTGRKINGSQLYSAVSNHYGSWNEVVRAVRKNPNKVGSNSSFWTKRSVIRSIKELHKEQIALNPSSIRNDRSLRVKNVLKRSYEGKGSGPILYSAATSLFDSWENALIEASLNPVEIRKKGLPVKRGSQSLRELIEFLYENGFRLNAKNIFDGSKDVKYLVCSNYREVISGVSILNEAKRSIGCWEEALRLAGLNPNEIVLRSKYKWTLSTIPHQVERVSGMDGALHKVSIMGEPIKTPEEIIEEQNLSSSLFTAFSGAWECDDYLYNDLLEIVSEIDSFENSNDFAEKVSERTGGKINKSKMLQVLEGLQKQIINHV